MEQDPAASTGYAAVFEAVEGVFRIGVACAGGRLHRIALLPPGAPAETVPGDAGLADRVVAQLRGYFADPLASFDVPLELGGTSFQRRVWRALMAIPPGMVHTYGMLARRLGTSPRAVGGACRANPVPVIVPCHRVVASGGLGGYAGHTGGSVLAIKEWLLEHESRLSRRSR